MRSILLFILAFLLLSLQDKEEKYNLHGKIHSKNNKGKLYILLVNKKSFKKPFSGIDTIIKPVKEKTQQFMFKDLPKGRYGIKCFQDINDNQKLDKGFMGPEEPYGFSWTTSTSFPIKFKDISFKLDNDIHIEIKMQ